MSIDFVNQNNLTVIKSNSLIEAPSTLTTFEQRIILYVISLIDRNDRAFKTYRIDIPTFRKFIGIDQGYNNQVIKEKLTVLLKKVVELRTPHRDPERKYILTHWLSSADVDFDKSQILVTIDPVLSPYLLQLKTMFTAYNLKFVIRFVNKYSFKIYELLKQYEQLRVRTFDIDRLKYFLGLEPGMYAVYKNFKNRILLPVQEEINHKSDIEFDFEQITRGRKVTGIKFIIKKKEIAESSDDLKDLLELVPEEHREKKTIRDIINYYCQLHDLEYIKRNIRYATKNSKNNYRKYLSMSLDSDWGLAMAEDDAEKAKKNAAKEQFIREAQHKEAMKLQEEERQQQRILRIFNALPEEKRQEIRKQLDQEYKFSKHLTEEIKIQMYYEDYPERFL